MKEEKEKKILKENSGLANYEKRNEKSIQSKNKENSNKFNKIDIKKEPRNHR